MKTTSRHMYALWVAMLVVSMAASQALAWNPPDGPDPDIAPDQADGPATPTTLLTRAHSYIIQNGISVLYNDGYWFAAQFLREWQQELLNGVRYADVYLGRQKVNIEVCGLFVACFDVCLPFSDTCIAKDWPRAANNHYFNPDTGRGLDTSAVKDAEKWLDYLRFIGIFGILQVLPVGLTLDIDFDPELAAGYPSALEMFDEEYANALDAYFDRLAPSIGGRQSTALAMFYLGWASHLMQDLTVVHHTFDEWLKGHSEYENAADGFVTSPPIANGQQMGIYDNELPVLDCNPGSRTCFASYAAYVSHDADILEAIDNGDYSNVQFAIPFAQSLQAGLYAAFLTDIGRRPVHMSAVIAAL